MNRRSFIGVIATSIVAPPSVALASPPQRLLDAIIQVESGGNASAVGDRGNAIGILQIWPVMVKDVNRIVGGNRYTLRDRLSRSKSCQMFDIYTNHYSKGESDEVISRRWNGGPSGDRKAATLKYWAKAQKELDKLS